MKKCVVRIRGGLGNQMFQYAFAYLLSSKENREIILDKREFTTYYWPFGLNDFRLNYQTSISETKQKYDCKIKIFHLWQFIAKKFHHPINKLAIKKTKKGFLFCDRFCDLPVDTLPDNIYLYGYFQNCELLSPIRADLTHLFSLKNPSERVRYLKGKISREKSVSISIRFSRNVELKKTGNYQYAGKDFYLRLLKLIESQRGYVPQLIISSNDIERIINENWFREYDDVIFLKDCSATEQIELMTNCRDYIISNSTFSWWGAYLGSYKKDSFIFAPDIWYHNDKLSDTKLYFEGMKTFEIV